jgi:4-aminobutyrate aminotransferase
MQAHHPSIGEVRGRGLMIGIEFVADRATREPSATVRDALVHHAFEHGLLLLGCGTSVVRIAPPLSIERKTVDEGLEIFDYCLTLAEQELGMVAVPVLEQVPA